jgi:site-specific recombinase XerD
MPRYTIRPIYFQHKINADGQAPIMIIVTIARKKRYFTTGLKVRPQEWKDGQVINHANAALYNRTIRAKIEEIEAEVLARQLSGETVTAASLKAGKVTDLFAFVDQVKKNMPPATQRRYKCEAGRVRAFAGDKVAIQEITTAFIRDYERHERDRGLAQNTLNTAIRWLRAMLNKAKKEGIIREVPAYQTPKYIQPDRVFLTDDDLQQWVGYWREGKVDGSLYTTLTWFLFGCYSGLRYSDWGQFDYDKQVRDDLLRLRATKNGRWVALPIGKTLAEIIAVAKDQPKPISADKTREHLKILAGRIGSNKHVTTHTARHTMGCMVARLGIPLAVGAELLGITERVMKVYFHLTGRDILEQAAVLKGV